MITQLWGLSLAEQGDLCITVEHHAICVALSLHDTYRRCHEKTSYVSNYAFFTLLHKSGDRGQMHRLEKLQ